MATMQLDVHSEYQKQPASVCPFQIRTYGSFASLCTKPRVKMSAQKRKNPCVISDTSPREVNHEALSQVSLQAAFFFLPLCASVSCG